MTANCRRLSRTSASLLGAAEGAIFCPNSMPRKPQVTRTKTIRKRERRELPTIFYFLRFGLDDPSHRISAQYSTLAAFSRLRFTPQVTRQDAPTRRSSIRCSSKPGRFVQSTPPVIPTQNTLLSGLPLPRERQYHGAMNLGLPEMMFIFVLALIIFGPKKLPEIGRQIGRALNEFKRASNEFKAQIESEIANIDHEVQPEILPPDKAPTGSIPSGTLTELPPPEPASNTTAKASDA